MTSGHVRVQMRGRIGVIFLNRAPSNALAAGFAAEVSAVLSGLLGDDAVDGIVLASDLPHFSAGTDTAELTQPQRGGKANLAQLCGQIAGAAKPVVAAIHGACLSAGLELALAAQARVASARAQFAFPDIKLGLMPAAGGTLRLPALVGAETALDLLLEGNVIPADQALQLDLIDQVTGGDVVAAAVDWAQTMLAGQAKMHRRDALADARAFQMAVTAARQSYAGQHLAAYDKIITCVEAGQFFPPAQWVILEHTVFEDLMFGAQAQGMCYAFVANQRLRGAPDCARGGAVELAIKNCLARSIADLQGQGHARATIIAALASFGVGVETGSVLPAPPAKSADILGAIGAQMVNCGAALLRQGTVRRASDFDAVIVQAGLFPRWLGGPLFQADRRGIAQTRDDVHRRAAGESEANTADPLPDALFDQLIATGLKFADFTPN